MQARGLVAETTQLHELATHMMEALSHYEPVVRSCERAIAALTHRSAGAQRGLTAMRALGAVQGPRFGTGTGAGAGAGAGAPPLPAGVNPAFGLAALSEERGDGTDPDASEVHGADSGDATGHVSSGAGADAGAELVGDVQASMTSGGRQNLGMLLQGALADTAPIRPAVHATAQLCSHELVRAA